MPQLSQPLVQLLHLPQVSVETLAPLPVTLDPIDELERAVHPRPHELELAVIPAHQ